MVPDRGAGDGAVSDRCRFHAVTIRVNQAAATPVHCELTETTLHFGRKSAPLIGLAAAFAPREARHPLRFDPEAIRATPEGTAIIADEYSPSIVEFDRKGHWTRDRPLPAGYTIDRPGATPAEEPPPHNRRGRQSNRGLEGLSLTPDGRTLVALMQGPLLQDGALDSGLKRAGSLVRLPTIDRVNGRTAQYACLLESPSYGLNEIEAVNDHEVLVIERDGRGGTAARFKRIAKIELADATPLDPQRNITEGDLPPEVLPAAKTWLIDLLHPR
ncbi:esterase-like activity of phytase family protein [Planctellipticum variicoloris]|nr:esterase-like activity of phytase family protein [Planctomycetaceae bacterium SH412]